MYTTALPQSVSAIQTVQTVQSLMEERFVLETDPVNKWRVMSRTMVMMRTGTEETVMSGPYSCLSVPGVGPEQVLVMRSLSQTVQQLSSSSSQSCCLSGKAGWLLQSSPATTINWLTGANTGAQTDLTSL